MPSPSRQAIFSAEALYRAYLDCRRRKRGTPGAVAFELRLADELLELEQELREHTYRPRPAIRFVARRPKLREIVAADFRDRVVHHLLVRELQPDWERAFIADSFACRPGRGTHAAVARLARLVRKVSRGGRRPAWYIQADIKSFFMSVDRAVLMARLDRRLRQRFSLARGPDPVAAAPAGLRQAELPLARAVSSGDEQRGVDYAALLWLARLVIFHDPIPSCVNRASPDLLARVPTHKTLAGARPGCGLPIGNLTSQFFGNVYLDALDQYVKHELRARHYLRYVDDFVILDEDPARLASLGDRIEAYLGRVLHLELNERRTRLRPIASGIDFLGYVAHSDHRLVRRRVVSNLRARLAHYERRLVRRRPGLDGCSLVRIGDAELGPVKSTLDSYLAHFAWADSYRLTAAIFASRPWLGVLLDLRRDARGVRVRPRFAKPRCPHGLRHQYRHFARRASDRLLLVQVGRHFELFDEHAVRYGELLRLRSITPRAGFTHRCGFSQSKLDHYLKLALEQRIPVLLVTERQSQLRPRERAAAALLLPCEPGAVGGSEERGP